MPWMEIAQRLDGKYRAPCEANLPNLGFLFPNESLGKSQRPQCLKLTIQPARKPSKPLTQRKPRLMLLQHRVNSLPEWIGQTNVPKRLLQNAPDPEAPSPKSESNMLKGPTLTHESRDLLQAIRILTRQNWQDVQTSCFARKWSSHQVQKSSKNSGCETSTRPPPARKGRAYFLVGCF